MKPICVPCQRFYRPAKNGVAFLEGMPTDHAAPGKSEAEKWKPYKLWMGGLWECPDCLAQIIVGVGASQIAEHYEPDFAARVKSWSEPGIDILQVNDC